MEQKQQRGLSRLSHVPVLAAQHCLLVLAASYSCPTQPLHKRMTTALEGWRSCLICKELIGLGKLMSHTTQIQYTWKVRSPLATRSELTQGHQRKQARNRLKVSKFTLSA